MTMNISVSIIIPVYQVKEYIGRCLESVMNQTYTGSMECLLVDDCGSDDSVDIALRMIDAYSGPIRFKVIRHSVNRGLSAARNTGLEHATGDYIFFLDSDDEITPECISLLMAKAEEDPSVELVQGMVRTDPYNFVSKVKRLNVFGNGEVRRSFYKRRGMLVAAWNKLIKRSFLIENGIRFDEGVIYEDTPWMFYLLKYVKKASFVSDVTHHYKLRVGSIVTSSGSAKKAKSYIVNYKNIAMHLTPGYEKEEVAFYAKKLSYLYARYAKCDSGFSSLLQIWREKAREYGGIGSRFRLWASELLARIKFGWFLIWLDFRVEDPSLLTQDLKVIMYRFQ